MIVLHGESSVGVRGKYESDGTMKKPSYPWADPSYLDRCGAGDFVDG
jgi:hypothetical protein